MQKHNTPGLSEPEIKNQKPDTDKTSNRLTRTGIYLVAGIIILCSAAVNGYFAHTLSATYPAILQFIFVLLLVAVDLYKSGIATIKKNRSARVSFWMAVLISLLAAVGLGSTMRDDQHKNYKSALEAVEITKTAVKDANQKIAEAKADRQRWLARDEVANKKLRNTPYPVPANTSAKRLKLENILADPRATTENGICTKPFDGPYTREKCPIALQLQTKIKAAKEKSKLALENREQLRAEVTTAHHEAQAALKRIQAAQTEKREAMGKLASLPTVGTTHDPQARAIATLLKPLVKLSDQGASLLIVVLVSIVCEMMSANALVYAGLMAGGNDRSSLADRLTGNGTENQPVPATKIQPTSSQPIDQQKGNTGKFGKPPIQPVDKRFLTKLGLDVDAGGQVRISQRSVARKTGMDRQTFRKRLDDLVELGSIKVKANTGGTTISLA